MLTGDREYAYRLQAVAGLHDFQFELQPLGAAGSTGVPWLICACRTEAGRSAWIRALCPRFCICM